MSTLRYLIVDLYMHLAPELELQLLMCRIVDTASVFVIKQPKTVVVNSSLL